MTKLEDKLIASIKKTEQNMPEMETNQANKAQTVVSESPASSKKEASAKTEAKQKPKSSLKKKQARQKPKSSLKKKQASVVTSHSILHPQRIWPD